MTPIQWFQLALLFLKIANWAAAKVDQITWKRQGYQEAIDEQMAELRRSAGIAAAVRAETAHKTQEEILRELEGNGELRD